MLIWKKTDGRATSNNRSALEADVSDLMNGLESLDKNEELDPAADYINDNFTRRSMFIHIHGSKDAKVETMLAILRKDIEKQTENVGTLFDVMYKRPSYSNNVAGITGPLTARR